MKGKKTVESVEIAIVEYWRAMKYPSFRSVARDLTLPVSTVQRVIERKTRHTKDYQYYILLKDVPPRQKPYEASGQESPWQADYDEPKRTPGPPCRYTEEEEQMVLSWWQEELEIYREFRELPPNAHRAAQHMKAFKHGNVTYRQVQGILRKHGLIPPQKWRRPKR